MKRIVEPEFLDTLPPSDRRAIRSRRDLRRVNFWMGNHAIMASALKENWHSGGRQTAAIQETKSSGFLPRAATQITELGAGDGNFLLQVARKLNWQNVNATLLDQQKIVSVETLAAFPNLGWRAEAVVADAFDWARDSDIIVTNLFLHHFKDMRLTELLRIISQTHNIFRRR